MQYPGLSYQAGMHHGNITDAPPDGAGGGGFSFQEFKKWYDRGRKILDMFGSSEPSGPTHVIGEQPKPRQQALEDLLVEFYAQGGLR